MSAGIEETNAIVQIKGDQDEPNVIATVLPLHEGLEAVSVNAWPSVRFDLGSAINLLHRFLPAGFYYKTFMFPGDGWNFYGAIIRKLAGLGRAPKSHSSSQRYEKRFHHCDVLVVGAGPAGLMAALAAGKSGARVMLVDEQIEPGGFLLNQTAKINGRPAVDWVSEISNEIASLPHIVHLQETTATGFYDHNMVYAVQRSPNEPWLRERLWRVRAKRVVIAAGAIERPLVFPDNDRPGVMLAASVATYLHRYAIKMGNKVVVSTNNNSAYDVAAMLVHANIEVVVIETRTTVSGEIAEAMSKLGVEILCGYTITAVIGTTGVRGVDVAPLAARHQTRRIRCDLVCTSGGWNPVLHLHSQSGARPVYSDDMAAFVPGTSKQAEEVVGAAAGLFALSECLREGLQAGNRAAELAGYSAATVELPAAHPGTEYAIDSTWEYCDENSHRRAFVDFQEDVSTNDIRLALRENYESVELVKRYTTAGMGIDQGKSSNVNVIGVIAAETGTDPGDIGTTTFRPPYSPVSLGAWAGIELGQIIFPARRTPITEWFETNNACFDEAGALWRRPFQIPVENESPEDAVRREAVAVRTSVGIYDGTPLGKFEIVGPDVRELLNRLYTNRFDNIDVGMGKFGFMLFEDGRMFDDGVTFRLSEDHYLMSSGSGVAQQVYAQLERYLQCEWRDLQVYVTDVTEQWANICVCGPQSREVLTQAGTDIVLDGESFPFMAIRTGQVAGMDCRVARVSYTGELSFEINVRARNGLQMWNALMEAGRPLNITPVGSETSLLLRLEKGFIAAWAEGAGNATLDDAGMQWIIDKNKPDFIGKRAMEYVMSIGGSRPQVVGLMPVDTQFVPPDGAPIIDNHRKDAADKVVGFVTAGGYSPNLGHSIALAQLEDGREKLGETVSIYTTHKIVDAEVTRPVFIDPAGTRMRS